MSVIPKIHIINIVVSIMFTKIIILALIYTLPTFLATFNTYQQIKKGVAL